MKLGLPSGIKAVLNECSTFQLPSFQKPLIECLAAGTMWHENFAGVLFCGLAIFCGLREQIFAVRDD